jgi:gamma-glutamylcyclotransferase (GGCT)/AIG2-like uncharacterized protein YtfP
MSDCYLFVYGTLMQGSGHPVQRKLHDCSEFIGSGWITGQLYQIRHYPGVIESASCNDKVYGELYRLNDQTLLSLLDDYEECSSAFPEPHEYLRKTVNVTLSGGQKKQAWAYIYNYPVNPAWRILSGRFDQR